MSKGLFVTGIGTDVGKTIVSAVLVKALKADYWKPVQCGELENTDTHKIEHLTGQRTLPESYLLKAAISPHAAADLESVQIQLDKVELPKSDNLIVLEGAGGIMVPFNKKENYLDLMIKLNLPVVLVTRNYLGSINHTMLSWKVLKDAGLKVAAVIISGEENKTTEQYLETQINVPFIRVSELEEVNSQSITMEADRLKSTLKSLFE